MKRDHDPPFATLFKVCPNFSLFSRIFPIPYTFFLNFFFEWKAPFHSYHSLILVMYFSFSLLCSVLYSSDLNTVILNLYDRLTKAKNNVPLPCSKEFFRQSRKGTFFSEFGFIHKFKVNINLCSSTFCEKETMKTDLTFRVLNRFILQGRDFFPRKKLIYSSIPESPREISFAEAK